MSEHYHRENRKARKPHRCDMCFRTIGPGETYLRGAGMDGTAWTWKECAHCEVLASWVVQSLGLDEYGEENLINWDPETTGEMRIKVQHRRQWKRRDGDLYPVPQKVMQRRRFEGGYEFEFLTRIEPGGRP